ncbi:MAG: hypothetical protein HOP29_08940 [Phycisphaerales bacterium]|nr:hypothetical protein [Phycisphaerales bacterium]
MIAAGIAVAASGCHEFPDVTIDDLPPSAMTSTASADHVRKMHVAGAVRTRGFEPMAVESQDGTVAHGPLWLDDPIEVWGDGNDEYAVTYGDWGYVAWSMGRFVANMFLMPVSMVLELPGTVMCSDGHSDSGCAWTGCVCAGLCARDAERCSGVTEPPDTHDTWGAMIDAAEEDDSVEPEHLDDVGKSAGVEGDE